jgi:NADH:ubiquinone oxidoreductase subunit K
LALDQTILLGTGTGLLFLGIAAIAVSKNLVKSIMSFQISVFGANLALFSSGLAYGPRLMSDAFVVLAVLVGASVEAVGLAIIVVVYKRYKTLNPDEIRRLRQ